MYYKVEKESDLREVVVQALGSLKPRDRASVLALQGDLGAGKTTFTQYLTRELGVSNNVTSPTYVIQKIYELTGQIFKRLVHIDAYRLESSKELISLGFEEILYDRDNLVVIEWPERVKDILPGDTMYIHFKHVDENVREIETDL